MNRNGLFFTTDALFAVVIAGFFIFVLFFILTEVREIETDVLYQQNLDMLRIMGTERYFHRVITGETQGASTPQEDLALFMNLTMRINTCATVELFDSSLALTDTIVRPGCTSPADQKTTARRFFAVTSDLYIAKLTMWLI